VNVCFGRGLRPPGTLKELGSHIAADGLGAPTRTPHRPIFFSEFWRYSGGLFATGWGNLAAD